MWYHWAILLIALYFTAMSLYDTFKPSSVKRSSSSYVTGSVIAAIPLAIAYWAYSSAMAPSPMMAGRSRH